MAPTMRARSPAASHPDISELYLAADVLITIYSSVMFDYAVTGKPLLFYVYDLAEYRDALRGFYFDLVSVAPRPAARDDPRGDRRAGRPVRPDRPLRRALRPSASASVIS